MKKKISILFVGNSHTYVNFVPAIVMDLFKDIGVEANCVMTTVGGKCMEFHYHFESTQFNIIYGKYDYVVLQNKASFFDPDNYMEYGSKIFDEYLSKSTAQPVIYQAWAHKSEPYNQPAMTKATVDLATKYHVPLAPAGEAFWKARKLRPEPELYKPDENHATPTGSYLAACTIFYALTGRKIALPVNEGGEPHTRLGIDTKLARKLNRVALETYKQFNR